MEAKTWDTSSGAWVPAIIGAQGYQGPQGSNGAQGLTGATGSQGAQGAQGTQGTTPILSGDVVTTGGGVATLQSTQPVRVIVRQFSSETPAIISGTTAVAESVPRFALNGSVTPTSTQQRLAAVYLVAGQVISNISFATYSTSAANSVTNTWAGIYTLSGTTLTLVARTADQGAITMGTSTLFTWAIAQIASGASSTYTVPTSGFYYVGPCITATTCPTLPIANTTMPQISAITPYTSGFMTAASSPPAIGTTYTMTIGTTIIWAALT
jgi:hypothetical protein